MYAIRTIVVLLLFSCICKAATVTHLVTTASTANASTYASGSFTPTAGDVLVSFAVITGSAINCKMTDSLGVGFGLAAQALKASSVDSLFLFVANKKATATSMTVTLDCTGDAGTGAVIFVAGVAGLTRFGPAAIRQSKVLSNQSTATPAPAFTSSVLTANPTIGFIASATNPAGITEPTGWTEGGDTGYATPTTGAEYVFRNSGFSSTTVTWGSTSSSAFGAIIAEIDISATVDYTYPNCVSDKPCLIQHSSWRGNNGGGSGEVGNTFIVKLPNAVLANDLVVISLDFAFNAGRTVTITDNDGGNTWTQGVTVTDAGNLVTSRLYYSDGTNAGTQTITIVFDTAIFLVNIRVSEFFNIATSSASDGTSSSASATIPTVQSGSITTGTSGDMIYMHAIGTGGDTSGLPNAYSLAGVKILTFTPGASGALLSADEEVGDVLQFQIQAAAGAITPTLTLETSTNPNTTLNVVAMAFKPVAGGLPSISGIRIVHVLHTSTNFNQTTTTPRMWFPSSGNLLIVASDFGSANTALNSVADGALNTWTVTTPTSSSYPQLAYVCNATTNNGLNIVPTIGASGSQLISIYYDVTGAATSCYDKSATASGSISTGNPDITNAPSITPSTANGLIIGIENMGTGPLSGAVSSGVFDNISYTGQTDSSSVDDSGDGFQHWYNTSISTVNIGWHVNNGSVASAWFTMAHAFKAPAATGSLTPARGFIF